MNFPSRHLCERSRRSCGLERRPCERSRRPCERSRHLCERSRRSCGLERHLCERSRRSSGLERHLCERSRRSCGLERHLCERSRRSSGLERHLNKNHVRGTIVSRTWFFRTTVVVLSFHVRGFSAGTASVRTGAPFVRRGGEGRAPPALGRTARRAGVSPEAGLRRRGASRSFRPAGRSASGGAGGGGAWRGEKTKTVPDYARRSGTG